MSTRASGARLQGVTRELLMHWQTTKDYWRDAKSLEFERQYLQELLASVDSAVTTIEQVDKLLSKIKKDCE
jgi:hypothetical protein